ncbi:MAG TPA: MFS transporter [Thermoanaerobaculia bacterium]
MSPNELPRSRLLFASVAAILYFSEGLPFGIVNDLLPVYLRVHHVELTTIGFLSTVASAWTLKVFWSPLIDAFGTYRRWIAIAVLAMAMCMMVLAMSPENFGPAFWTIIAIFAIASATQDLAVDALTIRATPPELVGPVNSIRVAAYRTALIVGGGGLVALSGVAGWRGSFAVSAAIAVVVLVIALHLPEDRDGHMVTQSRGLAVSGWEGPRDRETPRPRDRQSIIELFRGLLQWLRRPRAGVLLAIVLLYRLGELAIYTMIKPYWVDRGYSPAEIGTITTVIGVIVSIAGAIAGGAIVARIGLYRAMLWLGAAQILSNLGYAIVATTHAGRWAIYGAAIVENIGYGLGTGAFLAFLMAICDRERAATEYAMLTAAFGLTRVLIGTPSGWIAQNAGYASYFWLTVFLGIPGLILVPFVKERLSESTKPLID